MPYTVRKPTMELVLGDVVRFGVERNVVVWVDPPEEAEEGGVTKVYVVRDGVPTFFYAGIDSEQDVEVLA